MKAITLALTLGLLTVHAQAAEAVPVNYGHAALGLVFFLTLPVLFWLFFHSLRRQRVFSTSPKRRLLTWAAAWTAGPFLYLLPFGLTDGYLLPALVFGLCVGHSADEFMPGGVWVCSAVGWALFGALLASYRTRLLDRRAKQAPKLPAE